MDDSYENFVDSDETEPEISGAAAEEIRDSAQSTFGDVENFPEPEPVPEESPPIPVSPVPLPAEPLPEAPAAPVQDAEETGEDGGDTSDSLDLQGALGSLAAYFDTRSQLEETPQGELELVGIETYALSPITGSSGLKGVLLDVLGPYDNVVTQFKYQQANNSYYTYVNEITPDYPWIASAALFIALVLSLFGLLKRSMTWLK